MNRVTLAIVVLGLGLFAASCQQNRSEMHVPYASMREQLEEDYGPVEDVTPELLVSAELLDMLPAGDSSDAVFVGLSNEWTVGAGVLALRGSSTYPGDEIMGTLMGFSPLSDLPYGAGSSTIAVRAVTVPVTFNPVDVARLESVRLWSNQAASSRQFMMETDRAIAAYRSQFQAADIRTRYLTYLAGSNINDDLVNTLTAIDRVSAWGQLVSGIAGAAGYAQGLQKAIGEGSLIAGARTGIREVGPGAMSDLINPIKMTRNWAYRAVLNENVYKPLEQAHQEIVRMAHLRDTLHSLESRYQIDARDYADFRSSLVSSSLDVIERHGTVVGPALLDIATNHGMSALPGTNTMISEQFRSPTIRATSILQSARSPAEFVETMNLLHHSGYEIVASPLSHGAYIFRDSSLPRTSIVLPAPAPPPIRHSIK